VLVNVVDDAVLSTFHVPAIIDRSPARRCNLVGRNGHRCWQGAVRARLEMLLDHTLGPLAQLLGRYRERIRAAQPQLAARRRFYENVIEGRVGALLRSNRSRAAEQARAKRARAA
jgi:uroporphyrin-III C-methyltransferase/precorrin-2 dehydrogenase/sirohydrochlorin ferrochelatase